jgi:hypothetical protein
VYNIEKLLSQRAVLQKELIAIELNLNDLKENMKDEAADSAAFRSERGGDSLLLKLANGETSGIFLFFFFFTFFNRHS